MNQKIKLNLQSMGFGVCLALGSFLAQDFCAQAADAQTGSQSGSQAVAQSASAPTSSTRTALQVLANVNNEEIGRQKVVAACLEDYGQQVLASLVTRFILNNACAEAGVTVTDEEILAEIDATAKKFSIAKDQFLKLLQDERGVSPKVYADEIVRPQLALRKLAGETIKATAEDIQLEYERNYGQAVKVRMISVKTKEEAEKIRTELEKDATQFAALAQKYSTDSYTAALGGVVPPLRRHTNNEEVEKVVFSMKVGDLSQPIPLGEQFLILLCEEQIPASATLEEVKGELEAIVKKRKEDEVSRDFMQKLYEKAKIEIFYGDRAKMDRRPGAAAEVDGKIISIAVLGEECLSQYGKEALTGVINRTLIEQELKKRKIEITDADLQAKMAEEAEMNFPVGKDGKVDVQGWLRSVTAKHGVTEERFIRDAIWPSVALEKLAAGRFEVTDEDLQRGYEANYGKKVRCRAIVMNDMRTAQRVWGEARKSGTEEGFAELARKYSVEAVSRENGGEIPPIGKYSGQPEIENAAYALKEGELSGIIQVQNVCIILLCTGFTEPVGVTFDEVKELIQKDVAFKKMQMAIAEVFEEINDRASIENYLEGTVKSPRDALNVGNPESSLKEFDPAKK